MAKPAALAATTCNSSPRSRSPSSRRRVLPDHAVDRLAEEVGVAGVPGVLLDHVYEHAADARGLSVGPDELGEPARVAVGQHHGEVGAERATLSSQSP